MFIALDNKIDRNNCKFFVDDLDNSNFPDRIGRFFCCRLHQYGKYITGTLGEASEKRGCEIYHLTNSR